MGKNLQAIARIVGSAPNRPAFLRYSAAVVLPVIALGLTLLVADVGHAPFFPIFNVAILLSAIYGGTRAGITTVLVSVLLNLAVLAPKFQFLASPRGSFIRLIVFVIVGIGIAVLLGIIADIQRHLDYERERIQVTLASIGDGVIVTDAEGIVTFMNPVAERATGWKLGRALGRTLTDVFHIVNETTRAEVANPVYKVLERGAIEGLANHTVLVRPDGSEIPIDDSAAPIRDNSGAIAGVVLVFRDITARREAERVLLRQEKLATVGRLASAIAHEINNPLASVTNLLFLLQTSNDLPPKLKEFVDTAQAELSRAAHVAKQSLSFYRPLQSNDLIPVMPIVLETLDLYRSRLEAKKIEVVSRIDPDAHAMTSTSNLRQVLANLVSNSLDAMPPGGRLGLRVTLVQRNGNSRTRITVADSGHGIPPQGQAKLFEPFFTTKMNTGTGLGLWLSKQIVEADGGSIRLRSAPGKGTVFQVQMPGSAAAPAAGRGHPAAS